MTPLPKERAESDQPEGDPNARYLSADDDLCEDYAESEELNSSCEACSEAILIGLSQEP